ncbi:MAG: helix-turn-helix domain-containing protein [Candidatus Binatia bacterium]
MRLGTPGFIGGRLREVREARGMTQTTLAEILGVKRQAVSQYESGSTTPAPQLVARASDVLNVPPEFFRRPPHRDEKHGLFFRSMASATKTSRTIARQKRRWLRDIAVFVDSHVEVPKADFPSFRIDPRTASMSDFEEAAEETRKWFKLSDGPAPNLVALLERHGAIVAHFPLDNPAQSAFSHWDEEFDRPFVVLGSDNTSAVRSRFNAAHELAHMVVHREMDTDAIVDPVLNKLVEQQAHRFASAFLMPRESFVRDIYSLTLEGFLELKPTWAVAVVAMLYRCSDLSILPPRDLERLWVAAGRRGWRKREPLDDRIPHEQPRFLKAAIELILSSGACSKRELTHSVALNPSDIEGMLGLLQGQLAEIVQPTKPQLRDPGKSAPTPGAKIVPFRRRG